MELLFLGVVSFLAFIFTVWLAAHIAFGVYFSKLDKRTLSNLPEEPKLTSCEKRLVKDGKKEDTRTRGSFVSPSGKVYEDRVIEDFCSELNLNLQDMLNLHYNKGIEHHKGWTRG